MHKLPAARPAQPAPATRGCCRQRSSHLVTGQAACGGGKGRGYEAFSVSRGFGKPLFLCLNGIRSIGLSAGLLSDGNQKNQNEACSHGSPPPSDTQTQRSPKPNAAPRSPLHSEQPRGSAPLPPQPYLLPLAVGGELLGGDEEAEAEDRLELGRQPLRLEVLKLCLRLPQHRHIETEAEHLAVPHARLRCSDRPGRTQRRETAGVNFSAWWEGNAGVSHDTLPMSCPAPAGLAAQALPFYLKGKR